MKRGQESWLIFQGLQSPGSGMVQPDMQEVARGSGERNGKDLCNIEGVEAGTGDWREYQETQGLSGAGPGGRQGNQEVLLCERKEDQGKYGAAVLGWPSVMKSLGD